MKLISWKRLSLLMLLVLVIVSFGCSKKVAAPPPPPPPAPPPPPPPPAPTVTLNADRNTITVGQSVTLSYTAQNATSVTINPGVGAVTPATSGTRQVSPTANTSYTATATGPGGNATSAAVAITVNQPPPPPPPVVRQPPPPPPPAGPSLDELFARTMVPVLFDYDKYNIRPDAERTLLTIAAWLKQNPNVRFTTEGHADERGSQEYNIALGDERAAAVKKFLAGQGIADSRINTVSYGEERPLCHDANEECWQRNRRAAFVRIP